MKVQFGLSSCRGGATRGAAGAPLGLPALSSRPVGSLRTASSATAAGRSLHARRTVCHAGKANCS
eukprot:365823-Chlamydomonas_euryale.AAC.6